MNNIESRFWQKVDKSGGDNSCWEWKGSKHPKGYGCFNARRGMTKIAHRIAYILTHGEIPSGKMVCHKCDNPSCCNPSHLFLGSASDNSSDMVIKGRSPYGERQGHTSLTFREVLAIRRLHMTGKVMQKDLCEAFGVKQQTMSAILAGKNWKYANEQRS